MTSQSQELDSTSAVCLGAILKGEITEKQAQMKICGTLQTEKRTVFIV